MVADHKLECSLTMLANLSLDSAKPFVIATPAMLRRMLKSKIHRLTVTGADVDYDGSITLDRDLMDAADLKEFEEVHVWDVMNGVRLVTYVMEGERGSGQVTMNGAAALLVKKGDVIIVGSYSEVDERELGDFRVRKIFVDEKNRAIKGA